MAPFSRSVFGGGGRLGWGGGGILGGGGGWDRMILGTRITFFFHIYLEAYSF